MKCRNCGAELLVSSGSGNVSCAKCLIAWALSSPGDQREADEGVLLTESAHLFPEFEILGRIGVGGMGSVYRARQLSLDRDVAIKILKPALGESPEFEERFEREAKAMALLNHPNIVGVYDYGRRHDIQYLVMEYVDGHDLHELIQADAVDEELAFSIIRQLCEALSFAHQNGVIHRDVKPGNILVDARGTVKVGDFGLARIVNTPQNLSLTLTGVGMGTLAYTAPEQLSDSKATDARADIFSSGIVIYEMLTGTLPTGNFAPPTTRLRRRNRRLDRIVLSAMDPDPEQRIGDVKMLSGVLSPNRLITPGSVRMVPRLLGGMWLIVAALVLAGLGFWSLQETSEMAGATASEEESPPLTEAMSLEAFLPTAAFPFDPLFDESRRRGGVLKQWPASDDPPLLASAAGVDDLVALDRLTYRMRGWMGIRSDGRNVSNYPELNEMSGITQSSGFFHLRWDRQCLHRTGHPVLKMAKTPAQAVDLAQINDFAVLVTPEKRAVFVTASQWWPLVSRLEKRLENVNDVVSAESWGFTFGLLRESGEVLAWNLLAGRIFPEPENGGPFQQIAVGEAHIVGLGRDRTLTAWTDHPFAGHEHVQRSLRVPELEDKIVRVKSIARINVAQREDGSWVGWGDDDSGLIEKINLLGPALDLAIFGETENAKPKLAWIEPRSSNAAR